MRLRLLAALLALPAARLGAQGAACREPRYRWSVKTDTSLAALTPLPVAIPVILSAWEPPPLTSRDRCAKRGGRELALYRVQGWVRRVEKIKDDGDWHIELTDRLDSPRDSCIVAEIPPAQLSARYAQARADLDALLGSKKTVKNFNLAHPVRVQVTGAAFYDGQHRRRRGGLEWLDGEHGRCNSSARALWEIHPVYRVERP